jgi:hypothetical protein
MGIKLRKQEKPLVLEISMDDDMSFAIVELIVQAIAQWSDVPENVHKQLVDIQKRVGVEMGKND